MKGTKEQSYKEDSISINFSIFVVYILCTLFIHFNIIISKINMEAKMQKEKININLALSKELLSKIKQEASKKEINSSALIRLILQEYFEKNKNE